MKGSYFVWLLTVIFLQVACSPTERINNRVTPSSQEQDLSAMSPYVSQVVTGGRWQEGGHEGQYRMVASCGGWEHVRCEFFLQWVQDPEDQGKSPIVIATVPVPEINNRMPYMAKLEITERAVTPCIITVSTANEVEDTPYVIAITPTGIGKYAIKSKGAQ